MRIESRKSRGLTIPTVFAGGFTLLLLLVGAGLLVFRTTGSSFRWVNHTYLVILRAEDLLRTLIEAESNERGFLVTRDVSFLKPYEAAVSTLNTGFRELEQLVADSPRQTQLIAAIRPLLELKLQELRQGVEWQQTLGNLPPNESPTRGMTEQGRVAMEQIQAAINQFIKVETDLLLEREREFVRRSEIASVAIALAMLVATLFTGVAAWLLFRRMRELEAMVTICAWTKRVKIAGQWITIEQFLHDRYNLRLTHGISEDAARQLRLEALENRATH